MDTKNNFDTDIDVHPMPKRFMVYQYTEKTGWNEVKTCEGHELCIGLDGRLRVSGASRDTAPIEFLLNNSEIRIVQSTNLFDKDGNEIFEGSIVRGHWDYNNGIGELEYDIMGVVKNVSGCWCIVDKDMDESEGKMICEIGQDELEIIGHILSNPELLEEK